MRQLFYFIIIFVVVALWSSGYLDTRPEPCEEPILYTLGTFDNRFNITQTDFLKAVVQAEAVWEKAAGKELFTYTPNGDALPINLIYDSRQEATSVLGNLGSVLAQDEATYRMLETQYKAFKEAYEKAKVNYDLRRAEFEVKSEAYEKEIKAWNTGPRTSQAEFRQLEESKTALESELVELRKIESLLNSHVREINSLVNSLNHLASTLNLKVEYYNTIGASRGETFTGGVYYQSGDDEGIDIFEFSSREKLVRILAHELGHALGLEHVDDKAAIMYHLSSGVGLNLTPKDLANLETLCPKDVLK